MITAEHEQAPNLLKRYMGLTITLGIGVFLSIMMFTFALNNNMSAIRTKFTYEANLHSETLNSKMHSYLRNIALLERFFESSETVTANGFQHFTSPLLQEDSIASILWIPRQNIINQSYAPTLNIANKSYQSFFDPRQNNNITDYSSITAAISHALSANAPALSGNFALLSDSPQYLAIALPAHKDKQLIGIIVTIIDLKTTLTESLASADMLKSRNIYLYHQGIPFFHTEPDGIHFSTDERNTTLKEQLLKTNALAYQRNLLFGATSWTIIFTPTHAYLSSSLTFLPWLILLLGVFTTSVLGLFVFHLINQNSIIAQTVSDRTAHLSEANATIIMHEYRLKAILNTVLEGIITIDTKGIVQNFNPAAEQIFGYTSNEVIGKNIHMLMPEETRNQHNAYIKHYLDTGEAKIIGIGREVTALRKNGQTFPMSLGITEIQLQDEILFVGVVRDITKEKLDRERMEHYNQDLEHARIIAEKANVAKGEFLAMMSHEIRTPLNGIIGVADLIQRTNLSELQEKYAQTIQSSSELLLSIINDILDFSKIEANEMTLEAIPVVINALLEDIVQTLAPTAAKQDKPVEIVIRTPPELPLAIEADPTRLRQILMNLISNAIKFSEGEHILVSVKKQEMTEHDITLRFEIHNSGAYIPKEKLPVIFDHFTQADSSTTRKFGGTGLGLAICKRLVELMGSTIHVNSSKEHGTTFWFDASFSISQYRAETPDELEALTDKRVLIADSLHINSTIYHEYLEHIGCIAKAATNTEELFNTLQEFSENSTPFDVLLISSRFDDTSWSDICEKIKSAPEQYGDPACILLLDITEKTPETKSARKLLRNYIYKPIYPMTLYQRILQTLSPATTTLQQDNELPEDVHHITTPLTDTLPTFKLNVLVVEDFLPNQEVADNILSTLGCKVRIADSGDQALEILKKDAANVDVIFMDVQMPGKDGYQTSQEIRAEKWGKNIPIIALTANALKGDDVLCINAGMNDYLSKPLRLHTVANLLTEYFTDKK